MNAQVRALLVRRGIDLRKLEHGVTNSVIYIRGSIHCYLNRPTLDLTQAKLDEAQTVARLERALRGLPGVKDVVLQLDRVVKVGWRWKPR